MKFKNLIGTIALGTLAGCQAPLLLTELSAESKPVEDFKYYQTNFKLDENSLLNPNGYYVSDESERKLSLTLKRFQELKEQGISPAGFDINELNITSDTILSIKSFTTLKFYPDGTFSSIVFSNKSKYEIHQEMTKRNNQIKQGGSVYKLEENKILYESYTKISGFTYNDGVVAKNTVTVGKSKPYQFIQF